MGHFVFLLLHVAAILFAPLLLALTVPLHLIYGAVHRGGGNYWTHVRCPRCRLDVPRSASVCGHCGCELQPS